MMKLMSAILQIMVKNFSIKIVGEHLTWIHQPFGFLGLQLMDFGMKMNSRMSMTICLVLCAAITYQVYQNVIEINKSTKHF